MLNFKWTATTALFLMLASSVPITLAASTSDVLEQARQLKAPQPNSTVQAEYEGWDFWVQHGPLLQQAWHAWSTSHKDDLPELSREHMDPVLRVAVEAAWNQASTTTTTQDQEWHQVEERLRHLWKPVAPGVYACDRFLDPSRLSEVVDYLDSVENSRIPTRRPNGMNRYGVILDSTLPGAVHWSRLTHFCDYLVSDYVRPLGRLLFPDYVGGTDDDVESYAFTVRYRPDQDVSLKEHSDASLYTLNINLNRPMHANNSSAYEGSTLYFVDEETGTHTNVTFTPGMAVLHRGLLRHAAQPIAAGERTNLVLWVFGKEGYVRVAPYEPHEQMTPSDRWTRDMSSSSQRNVFQRDDEL